MVVGFYCGHNDIPSAITLYRCSRCCSLRSLEIDVITEPPPLPFTTNDFLLLNDVIDVEGEMRVVRLASAVFGSMCLNCCDCDIL